jgi:hypothetical protein
MNLALNPQILSTAMQCLPMLLNSFGQGGNPFHNLMTASGMCHHMPCMPPNMSHGTTATPQQLMQQMTGMGMPGMGMPGMPGGASGLLQSMGSMLQQLGGLLSSMGGMGMGGMSNMGQMLSQSFGGFGPMPGFGPSMGMPQQMIPGMGTPMGMPQGQPFMPQGQPFMPPGQQFMPQGQPFMPPGQQFMPMPQPFMPPGGMPPGGMPPMGMPPMGMPPGLPPMDGDRAARELAKNFNTIKGPNGFVGPAELQACANGTKSCTPEMKAAAIFLLNNPSEFAKIDTADARNQGKREIQDFKIGQGDVHVVNDKSGPAAGENEILGKLKHYGKFLCGLDNTFSVKDLNQIAQDGTLHGVKVPQELRDTVNELKSRPDLMSKLDTALQVAKGKGNVKEDGKIHIDDLDTLIRTNKQNAKP